MRMSVSLGAVGLALAGCTANEAPPTSPGSDAPPQRLCDAEPAQGFIGQTVSAALGAEILQATGAAFVRWGPPRTAFTKDYRRERVNIMYGDDMIITAINCG